eukprot:305003-Chlamydomonas_euryale.AAC.4
MCLPAGRAGHAVHRACRRRERRGDPCAYRDLVRLPECVARACGGGGAGWRPGLIDHQDLRRLFVTCPVIECASMLA